MALIKSAEEKIRSLMADRVIDPNRAPVAFGRLAVPQLFAELQQAGEGRGLPALTSLCDLLHDPELIYQTATGGTNGSTELTNYSLQPETINNQNNQAFKTCRFRVDSTDLRH